MPYSNGNAEHNDFESALATFTRHYASTENRQHQAWKGWMDYLQHQYDLDRAKWVAALDFDFFGPDIEGLCPITLQCPAVVEKGAGPNSHWETRKNRTSA